MLCIDMKKYVPVKGLSSTVSLHLPIINLIYIYTVVIIMLANNSCIYYIPGIFNVLFHLIHTSALCGR